MFKRVLQKVIMTHLFLYRMVTDYRKGILAVIVAVLFTLFVQSSIEAVATQPSYNDFCGDVEPPMRTEFDMDTEREAYDEEQEQYQEAREQCQEAYDAERESYSLIVFIVSTVIAILGVVGAVYIPVKDNIGLTISSGILLGSLITLFVGTTRGWTGIGEIYRPVVLLLELLLVVFVAYKALGDEGKFTRESDE